MTDNSNARRMDETAPWRWEIHSKCFCGFVKFHLTLHGTAEEVGYPDIHGGPSAAVAKALGLTTFVACNGLWHLCSRPECRSSAKAQDAHNKAFFDEQAAEQKRDQRP